LYRCLRLQCRAPPGSGALWRGSRGALGSVLPVPAHNAVYSSLSAVCIPGGEEKK